MLLAASIVLVAGLNTCVVADDAIRLTPVAKGGMGKIGYYSPQRATFSAEKPAAITKMPEGLTAAQFGVLPIGAGIHFIIDEPDGKPARLFVDSNANGDLSDDKPAEWTGKENKAGEKTTTMYSGAAMVDIGEKDKPFLVNISMYRFDKSDPARAAMKSTLLYYRDYAYEGEIKLGDKSYKAVLSDESASGDFRGKKGAAGEKSSGVAILIDVNANGKFDSRGESFDAAKPFNIAGTTYEIAEMSKDGASFRIVKSDKTVAEIPTPPDMGTGKTFAAFEAKDTEGKTVNFPADYKGKIVLVDFWATWCGPCMVEMPHVVAAYTKHHDAGFEILGVSLDNEKSITKMEGVMKDSKMTWRQIADGKGWSAELAQKFAINSIPATFLVDGTTGKILGANLRGAALDKAIEKALPAKEKK